MIFVTVGTDSHFDRLLKVVDAWAAETGRADVFAQIGLGGWEPRSIPFARLLEPSEFKKHFSAASVIVGHAGMGTILSAFHSGKPILVMPKMACLGEHRNEHQMATARRLCALGKINVAFNEAELRAKLDKLDELVPKASIASVAGGSLVEGIRTFIQSVSL